MMHQRQTKQEQPVTTRQAGSLWSNRDFLLLWNGQAISTLGTNVSRLALPLLVLALTHSPAQAGLLTALRLLPYLLFSLPAGVLVDRWNRKTVMIVCDIARWLALGSVPLAFSLGALALVQLYIISFLEGTAYVFFSLAQISALPRVVAPAHLARAYALDTTTEYIGTLFGPGLGGLIIGLLPSVAVGASLAYLTDSISYLASVVSLCFIRTSFQSGRVAVKNFELHKDIAEGLRFLWRQPLLRHMALLTMMINALLSPITLIVIVLAQGQLHLAVPMLGAILSAEGIGGVLGGFAAPWLRIRLQFGQIVLCSVIVWSLAIGCLMLAPSVSLLIIGTALVGVMWPIYGVTLVAYRLTITPDDLQGRVNSAFRFLSFGSEPAGAALGGILLAQLGPRPTLALIEAGCVLCCLVVCVTMWRKGYQVTVASNH